MERVAERRFGETLAPYVVAAWNTFSAAFSEFPYHQQVVYLAPLQMGPANLLWEQATGRRATMVGIPYDDLNRWRAVYPADTFISQLEKVAAEFERGLAKLVAVSKRLNVSPKHRERLKRELNVAEAAAIHFRSVANQARFVQWRDQIAQRGSPSRQNELFQLVSAERDAALRLYRIQARDSRIGFEATNHYFYVPLDLAEKVLNCERLLSRL